MFPEGRIALLSGLGSGSDALALVAFEWETSTRPDYSSSDTEDDVSEIEWLLTWLSDINGRAAIDTVIKQIRIQMEIGKNELVIEVYEGYYVDENDPDSAEVNPLDYPPGKLAALKFQFGDPSDESDYDPPQRSIFFEHVEVPVSPKAVKYLFSTLGYRVRIRCHYPSRWTHQVSIEW